MWTEQGDQEDQILVEIFGWVPFIFYEDLRRVSETEKSVIFSQYFREQAELHLKEEMTLTLLV